eukprot:4854131-Amphidinium_carterae.1
MDAATQTRADHLAGTLHLGLQLDYLLKYGSKMAEFVMDIAEDVGSFRREVLEVRKDLADHVHWPIPHVWMDLWHFVIRSKRAWPERILEILKTYSRKWSREDEETQNYLIRTLG